MMQWPSMRPWLLAIALIATFVPVPLNLYGYLESRDYLALTMLGCFLLLAWVLYAGNCNWLASRSLRWLGVISFGIYLVHYPAIGIVHLTMVHTHLVESMRSNPYQLTIVLIAGTVALTVPLALVIHKWVELPSNMIGRWLSAAILKGRRPIRPEAGA
jgi:peptidoglycan/LPS O-acetylase OafA/YrhL